MKIEICAKPVFWFELTNEQIAVLLVLSRGHYDGHCQQAGRVGGFIYGWASVVKCAWDDQGQPGLCSGDWRDLDTCLKLLEAFTPTHPAHCPVANALREVFSRALDKARELSSIKLEVS